MPRIPYVDPEAMAPEVKAVLQTRRSPGGRIFQMMANAGKATAGYLGFGAALRQNLAIDILIYEITVVRVGILSNCAYVIRQHEAFLRRNGYPEEKILALRTRIDSAVFSEAERAALKLVDEVVLNVRASDETFAEAQRHYGPEALMHIVLTVGQYMMTCRVAETFDVELEPPKEG